MLRQVWKIQY